MSYISHYLITVFCSPSTHKSQLEGLFENGKPSSRRRQGFYRLPMNEQETIRHSTEMLDETFKLSGFWEIQTKI